MSNFKDIFLKELLELEAALGSTTDIRYLVSANMEEFTMIVDPTLLEEAVVDTYDNGIVVFDVETGRVLHIEGA